jgi:uncharacterized protein YkwD
MNNILLGLNYIDIIIILVLLYFATEAWRHGFWVILADFISFLGSILISLRIYKFISDFLKNTFSLSFSMANALGFLLTAIIVEAILGFFLGYLISKIPKKLWKNKLNKFLAILPGLGEGVILISFLLTLIVAFPVKPSIKTDIIKSKIGSYFLKETAGVEKRVNEIFGGVIEDSLTYFTIKPGSKETVSLSIEVLELKVDNEAEKEIFQLVNEERKKIGVKELIWNEKVAEVARNHAFDMWQRKYFGHFSPEGGDVGDRLNKAKIKYSLVGENLALAPTVKTAHLGLMNSEGHRENILEPRFSKIGIGVVDNGVYGKMFVEVFTD